MKPVIALPFTELTVRVLEEPDLACLLRLGRRKQTVVGRVHLSNPKLIHYRTEAGWTASNTVPPPVVEVISRE